MTEPTESRCRGGAGCDDDNQLDEYPILYRDRLDPALLGCKECGRVYKDRHNKAAASKTVGRAIGRRR